MDTLGSLSQPIKRRRRHTHELKREVVAACAEPGRSVASVARQYQINTNMVHKWRREWEQQEVLPQTDFIPLPALLPPKSIILELPSPKGPVILHWPGDQLDSLAQWLRTVLA